MWFGEDNYLNTVFKILSSNDMIKCRRYISPLIQSFSPIMWIFHISKWYEASKKLDHII